MLIAKTGKRLNGRVHLLTRRRGGFRCFFASITRLSVYSRRTMVSFISARRVSMVIGYTTCATISGTRSGIRLYSGLGRITPNCLTGTTRDHGN